MYITVCMHSDGATLKELIGVATLSSATFSSGSDAVCHPPCHSQAGSGFYISQLACCVSHACFGTAGQAVAIVCIDPSAGEPAQTAGTATLSAAERMVLP